VSRLTFQQGGSAILEIAANESLGIHDHGVVGREIENQVQEMKGKRLERKERSAPFCLWTQEQETGDERREALLIRFVIRVGVPFLLQDGRCPTSEPKMHLPPCLLGPLGGGPLYDT
jgi:hypothetical protein